MQTTLPDIKTQFPEWYQEVVYKAQLADQSPVRGAMVVMPYGCALWENIKNTLDKKIKDTGHHNAIFPLLIPKSFLEKEAEHVEGFSPELAVVTHAGGKELEEPLVVRPTSETIIHYMFAQWLKSWRDLPIKINQWASIIRWEMRPRPFIRTTEIFWQEGHTAHETAQEANEEAVLMLNQYLDVYENYLAIPVVAGLKSESEKFPGADKTYTIEGLMPDGKSLQMCTSHLISQNFAKSFNMTYQDRQGALAYPYLTSWGFTTRSIGATVMVHGDQKGLVLPPRVAPIQVVIVPIFTKDADKQSLIDAAHTLAQQLQAVVRVEVDARDYETPGAKFYQWELKGVPLRLEIGPRDFAQQSVVLVDRLGMWKEKVSFSVISQRVQECLQTIQQELFARAQRRLREQWFFVNKLQEFSKQLEHVGGFYQTGWCQNAACEKILKNYKATIRCLLDKKTAQSCFSCDQSSVCDILIARSY